MAALRPPEPSFWRTWFARALGAWLLLAIIGLVTMIPLFELIGYFPYKLLLAAMGLGAVVLIGWSFWRFARRPRSGWVSPLMLVATAAAYAALAMPAANTGLVLNFLRHKPSYDRIVAEAKAGRLQGSRNYEGGLAGVPRGERFHVARTEPLLVYFDGWAAGDYDVFEIYYDEENCPDGNADRPVKRPANGGEPSMRALGYTLHLGGHYCLRRLII